ncbi:MAG TPA: hypothetical protein VL172_06590, partial [Kofleriaceae bacterium]|nr:hypothetical protein [Kofleriaceae bacterium]
MGAGVAVTTSAADALFLARAGSRHLGTLFALSSALLILVLGYVGAAADRGDRGRLLVTLALGAAAVVGLLGAGFELAPVPAAAVLLVAGKQVAAALDLAFWVLLAERVDARESRRLLPLLIAAEGVGTVAGSFAVGPLADHLGARGALAAGAALFACAAVPAL